MGKLPSIWIRVTFRIPVEIYKQFKAVCAKNHTTMSSVVREFMIAIIADEKRFDVTYGAHRRQPLDFIKNRDKVNDFILETIEKFKEELDL